MSVSLLKGKKVSSRFSVGINSTRGEAKGNGMTTLTASSNTTFRLDKRLIIDLQLNGSYRETEDFAFGVSPYEYAMNTAGIFLLIMKMEPCIITKKPGQRVFLSRISFHITITY